MVWSSLNFLQANLNHCAGAQDFLLQSMMQWEIDVAFTVEPYYVAPQPHWAGSTDAMVAIIARPGGSCALSVRERGLVLVAATWGEYAIIGVYFSPNGPLAEFEP